MSVDAASSPPELTQASSNCDLSVVIPVFNEEQNLKPLYQELMTVLEELGLSYEIIFIDDG
ncbi:MAG: glycosyltransferase, partial [Anaerolineales bacterium]|nr:glycosyltransferase [Anaerolineales bacterium]